MKITSIELFPLPPRWLFLKVTCEDGTFGWGEPVVEGRTQTVKAAIEELKPYIIGHDARNIEDLWQVLYRGGFYRGGPVLMSALAGVDQALWDIKGKTLGVPIYELLGGPVRDKMKMYSWIGGDNPKDVAKGAREKLDLGYKAVKMNGTGKLEWIDSNAKVEEVVANIASVREEVGMDLEVALDFHGRVHKGMLKRLLKALEEYHPFFVEEPVLSENFDAMKSMYSYTSIPFATGERMYSRWDFKSILEQGTVDIIQPDICHAGGISEMRRIAAMAETYDVALAPHCPLGPIALAASLQVDFTSPNALIQESSIDIHYNDGAACLLDYLVDPKVFEVKDGYIDKLTAPGLGIEIDEEKVRAATIKDHTWKNPIWRNEDGSFAEW
ncbi:MAG: galactonate dehydratase [Lentisphaeraceae bacterium]|nr:galactonate dehydratase [Lentisphaeraceae bacterium]